MDTDRPDVDGSRDAAPGFTGAAHYAFALAACLATTIAAIGLLPYFDLANIVMLFLVERFLKSDYLSASLGKM